MFGKTKLRCFLESAFAPLRRFLEASEVLLLETQQRTAEPKLMRYLPHRLMRWWRSTRSFNTRIDEVLSSGKQEGSKLNMLKALQDAHEGDRKMSKAELTDEILTLLEAGHETTGYTTSWALYEVAGHPEVQEKILAETSAVDLDTLPMTSVSELAALHVDGLAGSIALSPNRCAIRSGGGG